MTEVPENERNFLVRWFNRIRGGIYFNILLAVSIVFLFFAINRFASLSGLAEGIFKSAFGMAELYVFMRFVVERKVNVWEEIINGNMALGLYVLAFAIIIAACLA